MAGGVVGDAVCAIRRAGAAPPPAGQWGGVARRSSRISVPPFPFPFRTLLSGETSDRKHEADKTRRFNHKSSLWTFIMILHFSVKSCKTQFASRPSPALASANNCLIFHSYLFEVRPRAGKIFTIPPCFVCWVKIIVSHIYPICIIYSLFPSQNTISCRPVTTNVFQEYFSSSLVKAIFWTDGSFGLSSRGPQLAEGDSSGPTKQKINALKQK